MTTLPESYLHRLIEAVNNIKPAQVKEEMEARSFDAGTFEGLKQVASLASEAAKQYFIETTGPQTILPRLDEHKEILKHYLWYDEFKKYLKEPADTNTPSDAKKFHEAMKKNLDFLKKQAQKIRVRPESKDTIIEELSLYVSFLERIIPPEPDKTKESRLSK